MAGLAAATLPRAVALAQGALGTMTTLLSKTLTFLLLALTIIRYWHNIHWSWR